MPVRERPWQSDHEIEAAERQRSLRQGASMQKPRKPFATYILVGTIVVVFIVEQIVARTAGEPTFTNLFVIHVDWLYRPWSLVTSTLSHGGVIHLLFNGVFLYFFGPTVENVIGWKKYLVLFFTTGAISGVVQVTISQGGALGASGALMALLGLVVILMPKSKIFIFPIFIPIPLWLAAAGFALLDVLGVFAPESTTGHVAHLSGLAIGLLYGLKVRKDLQDRGLRLVTA